MNHPTKRTYPLYHVRYNKRYREMFLGANVITEAEANQVHKTFEPNPHYYDIVKTEQVPVKFDFCSTYIGESDYEYNDPDTGERHRVHFRIAKEQYEGGHWNFTKAEFEREINAQLHHVWMMGGQPLPPKVFAVFKKLHPDAINGRAK